MALWWLHLKICAVSGLEPRAVSGRAKATRSLRCPTSWMAGCPTTTANANYLNTRLNTAWHTKSETQHFRNTYGLAINQCATSCMWVWPRQLDDCLTAKAQQLLAINPKVSLYIFGKLWTLFDSFDTVWTLWDTFWILFGPFLDSLTPFFPP